jgi:membrane protease YdiL (CAAX protease family)
MSTASEIVHDERARPVAPWWHSLIFLLIIAGTVRLGYVAQHRASAGPGLTSQHTGVIKIYAAAAVLDWLLFWFCWWGVSLKKVSLRDIFQPRWNSLHAFAIDMAWTIPFWFVWEYTALGVHKLLGPIHARTVDILLPQSVAEVLAWIGVSITAGIAEEFVFRGYVQRQVLGMTNNIAFAVVLQGIIFGAAHAYQGWKNVVVISVLGILYGVFAVWRKSLLPNVVAHAFTDIYEGWLKFVLFR